MTLDIDRGSLGYRFCEFELNLRTLELTHRGVPRRLEPKVWDLLIYLLRHRDRVVSKPELFRALWRDTAVCEGALQQCVSVLRRALGDTGRAQALLKTYPRVGYRFVGLVEELMVDDGCPDQLSRWWRSGTPAVPASVVRH